MIDKSEMTEDTLQANLRMYMDVYENNPDDDEALHKVADYAVALFLRRNLHK